MAKRRKRTKTKRNRMAKSRKMARSRTKKLRKKNKRGGAGGESVQAPAEFEHLLIKLLLASMGYNENGESVYEDVGGAMVQKKLKIVPPGSSASKERRAKSELNKYIPLMSIDNLKLLIKLAEEKNTEIQRKTGSEISLSELNFQPIPGLQLSKFKLTKASLNSWMSTLITNLKELLEDFSGGPVGDSEAQF